MNTFSRSLWASVIATSFMTAAFFRLHKALPTKDKKPLPPAQLTESLRRKVTQFEGASDLHSNATMLAHYGYGFACAGIFSAVAPKVPGNALAKGMAFGAGVWAASYFGLIPAINGRPQGPRMTAQRNGMMIAAHLIWGAALGYADKELYQRGNKMLDGRPDISS